MRLSLVKKLMLLIGRILACVHIMKRLFVSIIFL